MAPTLLHANRDGAALAAGAPDAFVPADRRRALATGIELDDRVRGAALFADIAGFTPLTEALASELGAQRGAEELTGHLNRVFQALIDTLGRFDGHVIYFSGDAITCWLDGDDGLRAATCAFAMQDALRCEADVVTPGGLQVRLAMKVAIAVGPARRFVVGDPAIQRIDVLAGRVIDALAVAERHALRDEVVLTPSALASLDGRIQFDPVRTDDDGNIACAVLTQVTTPAAPIEPARLMEPLAREIVAAWLLPDLHAPLFSGRSEFLAELRPAYPLFLSFGGIDYDSDDDAQAKLDGFVREAQRIVTSFGGNVLTLTLGDKGAYLYAVFGAPVAHEDDAARAATAALGLRALEATTGVTDLRIGIAHGRLRSGMYGHAQRQAFTCLGDAVNVAARLMGAAPPGTIRVTEPVQRAAGEGFEWHQLAPIEVKGKAEALTAFVLAGAKRHARRVQPAAGREMFGRQPELGALCASLDDAIGGQGRVIGLAGEAGIGKSRLVAAFTDVARARNVAVVRGECQSYGTNAGYFVWRDIWRALFGLDAASPDDAQVAKLEREVAAIDDDLLSRAPLLAGLLDLPLPANDLTGSFDAKLRKSSLEALLVRCLAAKASEAPRVLVLEDCHWLDPLSRDLLEALVRSVTALPVLFVLAYRRGGDPLGIEDLPLYREIALDELEAADCALLARARLQQMLGEHVEPSPSLLAIIAARAQGNPFYIEELFNYIRSEGIDPRDERALQHLELPTSLHSLILSRLDRLDEAPRQVLKVASVVGREFRAAMLPGVYPELGGLDAIREALQRLGSADLVRVEQEDDETYLFKHMVTREVVYESMPFAFRSRLHDRVGDYIEETESDRIERNLDLLAHHYWHGDNRDKKREYLGRAGSAAQSAYANAVAIDYFERLAPLLSKGSRLDVLLKLGKVHELVGNWRRAQEVDNEALAIAEDLDDSLRRAACQTALAEVVRKQGHYQEALDLLNRAVRGFASFGDELGVARVLHLVGTVWAQRGNYDKALESYNKSLAIRERIGDKSGMASLLSNLGIVAEHRGDYAAAEDYHRRALTLRESVGERWAIGNSMTNLGMIACVTRRYDEAREWFDKSMAINREIGDAWMVATCHNNLGNAHRGLGEHDVARAHYAESLRAYRDYDDRWALAFLLEDIAILAASTRNGCVALRLIAAVDALRTAIGAPRAPALAQDIDAQLAAAVRDLPPGERDECRTRGSLLHLGEALDLAFTVCARA
jgi:class 3 adenylate cyclase/tetratricopeptide (TPR) repeat protein